MKIKMYVPGYQEYETDLSIDRLEFGAPTKDEQKCANLYLSGPFKEHQEFLGLVSVFNLSFEGAIMEGASILQVDVTDNMETIRIQIAGRIKIE